MCGVMIIESRRKGDGDLWWRERGRRAWTPDNSSIPSFIPIKESLIYLGITIHKNIHKIARDNFNNILVKVKNDIQRWKKSLSKEESPLLR